MYLMGDIKVRVYYSTSGNAHLSDCGIGILVYVFYETLDFHYKKVSPFRKLLSEKLYQFRGLSMVEYLLALDEK